MSPEFLGGSEVTMSTTASQPSVESPSKELRLANYLREKAAEKGGELYFKGKFIADDVGLSSKEIGALMLKLTESATDMQVEKWSYTSATTWRVELA
ncbi:hypothetical protein SAMN04487950_0653 [Halogranum rubrum]|uniref:DUF7123 domain-containing protein n=2 Tax=Halogranum rubrum TaxID=553466 RepID=A0A1I4BMH2_9EURY|nr:hypothetical protein SAMN04487950_0653 [Halogranum rubrum]